jgi:D-xylose 1-dehydrogenase (NADP+, D-xylono-1,5-lactone-forming)
VLSEAFMYRYHPQTARLVELVGSGAIGELRVIRSAFSYSLYDASNIRLRTDVEGGALMDVGCYCVSGARLLAGEPESVAATAYTGPSGTDWVFTGMLRFPGDVVALFDCGTSLPDRDELEAIGTEGSVFLDDPWHCDDPVIELRRTVVGEDGEDAIEVEEIEVGAADPYRLELEAMNAAIRGDAGAVLGREDAVGQVRVIDALFRAAAGGETVTL